MNKGEPFPDFAIEFLEAFYRAKNAYTYQQRYLAIKDAWNLQHSTFYCEEGQELKIMEFYVLTKLGLL